MQNPNQEECNEQTEDFSKTPKWIWYPENRSLPCTFIFFRKEIELDEPCISACGSMAADSRYQLFVNGTLVQRGPAPFDPRFQETEPFDIIMHLKQGRNVIGILVCYFGHYGEGTYIPGNPGFWFEMKIKMQKKTVKVVSDSTWKALRAKCWKPGSHKRFFLRALQEVFDARLYPYGWNEEGFNDDNWRSAKELKVPEGKPVVCGSSTPLTEYYVQDCSKFEMRQRDIPYLDENRENCTEMVDSGYIIWKASPEEYFEAYTDDAFYENRKESPIESMGSENGIFPLKINVNKNMSSAVVFNLKEEMTGMPFVKIKAPAGTVVDVVFSEAKKENELMLPAQIYGQWLRVITKEGETYHEAFDYEAVKYIALLIRGEGSGVEIMDAGITRRTYPFEKTPDFECSDELLNKIHTAGINTCRNVSLETIVDNVVRERQQYAGDVGITKQALYLGFGEYRLPERMIRTFAQGQNASGWFLDCYPAFDRLERLWQKNLGLSYWGPIIDHGIGFIFDIYNYVLYSGDKNMLKSLYEGISRHAAWLKSMEDEEGLLPVENTDIHTVWIDHDGFEKQRHKQASLNIYYYGYLDRIVPAIASWMNDKQFGQLSGTRAINLKEKIIKTFWDDKTHTFVDNLPWIHEEKKVRLHDRTISMSLLFNLILDEHIEGNLKILSDCPEEMGFSHPANAGWRLWALSRYGREDIVIDDLRNRWGNMNSFMENNTFSEKWEMKPLEAAWCQCAVAPVYILYGEVLGIKPVEPGFGKYIIKPQIHDLEKVYGSVKTPNGNIVLNIEQKSDCIFDVWLPEGLEAVMVLPGIFKGFIMCEDKNIGILEEKYKGEKEIAIRPENRTHLIFEVEY